VCVLCVCVISMHTRFSRQSFSAWERMGTGEGGSLGQLGAGDWAWVGGDTGGGKSPYLCMQHAHIVQDPHKKSTETHLDLPLHLLQRLPLARHFLGRRNLGQCARGFALSQLLVGAQGGLRGGGCTPVFKAQNSCSKQAGVCVCVRVRVRVCVF